MAFRQVKDLLHWVVKFHDTLGTQYRNLSDEQSDERMTMALDFLAKREDRMRQSIERYLEDAKGTALDVWLQDSQDFVHPRLLERIPKCFGCHGPQDIFANAMTAHRTLYDMYHLRAELAQMPAERELFEELAENQQAEARLQARDIGRLEMY
jgi:hypothetical protein